MTQQLFLLPDEPIENSLEAAVAVPKLKRYVRFSMLLQHVKLIISSAEIAARVCYLSHREDARARWQLSGTVCYSWYWQITGKND